MPLILIAGTVVGQPKAEIFPASGRPRCEARIKVEGDGTATIYRVIGFDDQTEELETLIAGDSVAIQGSLEIESKDRKIVGLFVVALQVMALGGAMTARELRDCPPPSIPER